MLTGRYDAESGTGDAAFPGHGCVANATSRSRDGFLSDDALLSDGHMGLGIGGAHAFEVEFVEITRAGFAGLRINQTVSNGTVPPRDGIRLHDLYIHDTASEGIYFGSTQGAPTPLASGLQIYNCRLVHTGTEALQSQNFGTARRSTTTPSPSARWTDALPLVKTRTMVPRHSSEAAPFASTKTSSSEARTR
ncbi:hypothetical protein [Citreicoccus inhibens]|uniref:hypothetical protein n=1 Tax=Citreicoccus inhibens TaxID=2849499 RepID=UPI001F2159D0|nr:hypothetical protein [Citreicoccus inhibens]